jgi:hypothetical protein
MCTKIILTTIYECGHGVRKENNSGCGSPGGTDCVPNTNTKGSSKVKGKCGVFFTHRDAIIILVAFAHGPHVLAALMHGLITAALHRCNVPATLHQSLGLIMSQAPTLSRTHKQNGAIALHRTNLTIFSRELQTRPKVAYPTLGREQRRRLQDSVRNRDADP